MKHPLGGQNLPGFCFMPDTIKSEKLEGFCDNGDETLGDGRAKPVGDRGPPDGGTRAWLKVLGSFLVFFNIRYEFVNLNCSVIR